MEMLSRREESGRQRSGLEISIWMIGLSRKELEGNLEGVVPGGECFRRDGAVDGVKCC